MSFGFPSLSRSVIVTRGSARVMYQLKGNRNYSLARYNTKDDTFLEGVPFSLQGAFSGSRKVALIGRGSRSALRTDESQHKLTILEYGQYKALYDADICFQQ
jgi:hypothetical protein